MDPLTIIVLSLVFSAFFSGCEMAFFSSNKLLLELNKKKNPFPARIIDIFVNKPGLFIATILIGNNVALVIYGLQMSELLEPFINVYVSSPTSTMIIQTIFSTLLILLTAEFLPKTLFRIHPTFVLNIFALPLLAFYSLFYPISKFTLLVSDFIISKILRTKKQPKQGNWIFGRIDLDNLLTEHREKSENDDHGSKELKFLKNALDLSKLKIRDCVVPRPDLVAIDENESLEQLQKLFIETGFSKILVYKNSIDHIIGYVHVSALFKRPKTLKNIISSISIVPETMTANAVLELFTQEHKSITVVVDEFGGTAGIVTLEDILEEIFGEINDEHDTSDYIEELINDTDFHFSGRLEIDYLNDKYKLNLPQSDNYETLAGLILFYNKSIPVVEEEIIIHNFSFTILKASNARIELVKVTIASN